MYLTDGIHLYEVIDEVQNFGRLGGMFLWVQDCLTGRYRQMGQLEQALCSIVGSARRAPYAHRRQAAGRGGAKWFSSSRRDLIPSFPYTLRRCHSTVRGLRKSWAPISAFESPRAARRAACTS